MDDLIAFLRARLDEDEANAAAASPGPWHVDDESSEVLAVDDITVADGFALSGRQLRATTAHIARHHPIRILAEVEAKRRMLRYYEGATIPLANTAPGSPVHDLMSGAANTLRASLLDFAQVHADHPDYREEWRP